MRDKQLYLCSNSENCPDPECPCRVPHEPEDFGGGDTCIDEKARAEVCHRTNIHCECLPVVKPMDKWDNLIIRHVKSRKNDYKTLQRIWAKRCNMDLNYVRMPDVENKLVRLVEEYKLASLQEFVQLIRDSENGYLTNYGEYNNHVLNACCSLLKHATITQLKGYVAPLRYTLGIKKAKLTIDNRFKTC
jgi:hypothetical protein